MEARRLRISRLARWSALLVVGTFVVLGCRPEESTTAPTEAAATQASATEEPSTVPVLATIEPSEEPTLEPTLEPTPAPTPEPTLEPTPAPTPEPTLEPTPEPSVAPASEAPAASASPVAEGLVTGTIVLPMGVTLPADAIISVELQDTSLADAPAVTIGETSPVITDPTVVEIPFEIAYDPAAIDELNTYTVSVRIEDAAGTLLFINDTSVPVITNDAPTEDVPVPVIDVQTQAAEVTMAAAQATMAAAEESATP